MKKKRLKVRQKAARRTADGRFTKAIFTHIGGKEVPRYAAFTWKERDAAHKEFPVVKARYERHMSSVK